ncbi:MAG: hypothetical protein KDA84_06925 [Planctomycetaceae bacterium]|nr:hypothetical protein [Planctomycetaceae bacterium]
MVASPRFWEPDASACGLIYGCRVQLAWSKTMHDGADAGQQSEPLTAEEWGIIPNVLSQYS